MFQRIHTPYTKGARMHVIGHNDTRTCTGINVPRKPVSDPLVITRMRSERDGVSGLHPIPLALRTHMRLHRHVSIRTRS